MTTPVRIAVAGTHSTGKTTLVRRLETELRAHGYTVARTPTSFAAQAADLGFPKLQQQTAECTEWIIAASAAASAQATLAAADAVLIDRSALDPVAYYLAALERSDRQPPAGADAYLRTLAHAYAAGYDLLLATVLDPDVPLGEHRDRDLDYRAAVDAHLHQLLGAVRHQKVRNHPSDQEAAIQAALTAVEEADR
ncbi:AAA family ATPase [Streptomyces echinoruber]|uniref:AAA family ATPase n=1 Tax=Streptomyces echinoruber TaxID=68898 RepID=UPI0016724FF8|nr:AAA family ATPase [Streptomyces echinoruber]